MAQADGTIIIDTLIDTKGFQKGSVNLQSQFGKLAGAAKKLGLALGGAFAAGKIVQFGKEAIELGSDLSEVQNVVDVTFGSLNSTIDSFARNAITQFGLSELSAKRYASTIGAMLKSMGMATEQAAAMSMEITGLAGDMASFYNLAGDDAFAKLRAGISGETEPLKQLGINLSVANLEQYALAQGITKTYKAMTEQEKALLRYNYLLSVTSDAQGDFARTSNSWANQTKILAEQFNSLKATIGQGLINVLTPVLKVINTILSGLQAVANAFRQFTALLFGSAGGGASQVAQDIASGFDSAAGGASNLAKETGKAAKEARKFLASFDEITKIGEKNAGGSSGGGGEFGGVDFGGINLGGGEPVEDNISPQIQAIVDKCLALIAPLRDIDFTPLRESLAALVGHFSDLGSTIRKNMEWEWFNILVPLSKWTIEKAAPEVIWLLVDAFRALSNVIGPVNDGLKKLMVYLAPVFEFLADTGLAALGLFRDLFSDLADLFEEKGPQISGIIENIGKAVSKLWEVVGPILSLLVDLVAWAAGVILGVIVDAIGWIIDTVYVLLDAVVGVIDGLSQALGGIIDFLCGVFTLNWERAWGGLCDIVKGVVNVIISVINGLVDSIRVAINFIIRAINRIKFTIPDWVPVFGGEKFGLNLKEIAAVKIPYLAKGAVIPPNAPFLAMLGDQKHGTNIEAPLSTIEDAVERVMTRHGGASDERIVVLLSQILEAVLGIEIDGATLNKAIDNYRRKEAVMRGS